MDTPVVGDTMIRGSSRRGSLEYILGGPDCGSTVVWVSVRACVSLSGHCCSVNTPTYLFLVSVSRGNGDAMYSQSLANGNRDREAALLNYWDITNYRASGTP